MQRPLLDDKYSGSVFHSESFLEKSEMKEASSFF
jgi:hypothetical protein